MNVDGVVPASALVTRDPAWTGRVFWLLAAAVVLWPLLVLAEFKPWILLSPESLKPTLRFLSDFVPPRVDPPFLLLVARETWRTVAIATAGLALAMTSRFRWLCSRSVCSRSRHWPAAWRRRLRWCA